MLKVRFYPILSFFALFAGALSCSEYEKVLKSEDPILKFDKAFYYYNREDYVKASTLFDQLAPIMRGTRKADSVYFYQAMSQYHLGDYIISGHYFNSFVSIYQNSGFIEEATFMEAMCYYEQSPRPELDQTPTNQAIDAFRLYLIKYPNSERSARCREIISELNGKLMEKSYLAAKMYYFIDNYKAAIVSFNNCLTEFPDTKYREEIMFLLLKSKYNLAVNSIVARQTERFQDAVDEYFAFVAEFPESKSRREADDMYKNASVYIKDKDTVILNN